MFTKTGMNAVESSEGFSVARLSRNDLQYSEGPESVIIEVEPGNGLAIYASTLNSWNHQPIDSAKKEQILARVSDALKYMEVEHIIC
jgi:hypothetical protein